MPTAAVRVALRVRPLTSDIANCITYIPNEPQVLIGHDRSFTFDSVYSSEATQEEIYTASVAPLLDEFMVGKNATVLAYGQTGSGKTYSMGMTSESYPDAENQGVVPRFVEDLFSRISTRKKLNQGGSLEQDKQQQEEGYNCHVHVSFLELYKEDLRDLLASPTICSTLGDQQQSDSHLSIREDIDGNIYCSGLQEEKVESADEVLDLLKKGSRQRITGTTGMNQSSSRSHAIFTIVLKQQLSGRDFSSDFAGATSNETSSVYKSRRLVSKFHFVDLAGSERLKRTQAVGDRQKECISINGGLLALGNVISALGDDSKKKPKGQQYVPYRDSKLTRLLQDSLGGNSCTLILACISPSTLDYAETLNTLKYANRARNIENRVEINHDYGEGSPEESRFLRSQISQLKLQVAMLKKLSDSNNHISHSRALEAEVIRLKKDLRSMREYSQKLLKELSKALPQDAIGIFGAESIQSQYCGSPKLASANIYNPIIDSSSSSDLSDLEPYLLPQQWPRDKELIPSNKLYGVSQDEIERLKSTPSITICKRCRRSTNRSYSKESLSLLRLRPVSHKQVPTGLRMKSRSSQVLKSWRAEKIVASDLVDEVYLSSDSMLIRAKENDNDDKSTNNKSGILTRKGSLPNKLLIDETVIQRPYTNEDFFDPLQQPPLETAVAAPSKAPDDSPSPKKRLEKRFSMSPRIAICCPDSESKNDNSGLEALSVPAWLPNSVAPLRIYQSMDSLPNQNSDSEITLQQMKLSAFSLENSTMVNCTDGEKRDIYKRKSANKNAFKSLHQPEAELLVKRELMKIESP